MEEGYAVTLDNFFPSQGKVTTRRGSKLYTTLASGQNVQTLFEWVSGANKKLLAFSGGKVYNISAPPNTEEVTTGITSDIWQGVNYGGHGIFVNGVDDPLRINQAGVFVDHGFSSATDGELTPSKLFQVLPFKHRLFFAEKDSPKLWYGGTQAVTGSLNSIDLSLVHGQVGHILALGTLTLDGGEGVDDLLVIFCSSGDVLIYEGTDPASAANWRISGMFHIGPVIGNRPLLKLGGDLIAITPDGFIPLLGFLKYGRAQTRIAISDAISNSIIDAVRLHKEELGWESILYSEANWLLFNIPQGGQIHQYVQNTVTGAWCRFIGMEALTWVTYNGRLFYGAKGGKVFEANVTHQDDGLSIKCKAQSAYSYLSSPYDKVFQGYRIHAKISGGVTLKQGLGLDFQAPQGQLIPIAQTSEGLTLWNTANWNIDKWSEGPKLVSAWQGINGAGSSVSLFLEANTTEGEAEWFSGDLLYNQQAGALGL